MARIWNWLSHASTAWGLLPSTIAAYVGGALWMGAMAIVGVMQGVQVFWIMMGLPLAAAAIVTLALRSSEWRQRISAANKLQFHGVQLTGDYKKDDAGKVIAIRRAQVMLLLKSAAPFPIAFVVDELRTSFEGSFPPNRPRDNIGATALAHELKAYIDHPIEMQDAPIKRGQLVFGTALFKLRYGHPGREKYSIAHNLGFEASFDDALGIYALRIFKELPANVP